MGLLVRAMTDKECEDVLMVRAAKWGVRFAEQVTIVGGVAESALEEFSEASISLMIRNGLEVRARD